MHILYHEHLSPHACHALQLCSRQHTCMQHVIDTPSASTAALSISKPPKLWQLPSALGFGSLAVPLHPWSTDKMRYSSAMRGHHRRPAAAPAAAAAGCCRCPRHRRPSHPRRTACAQTAPPASLRPPSAGCTRALGSVTASRSPLLGPWNTENATGLPCIDMQSPACTLPAAVSWPLHEACPWPQDHMYCLQVRAASGANPILAFTHLGFRPPRMRRSTSSFTSRACLSPILHNTNPRQPMRPLRRHSKARL